MTKLRLQGITVFLLCVIAFLLIKEFEPNICVAVSQAAAIAVITILILFWKE